MQILSLKNQTVCCFIICPSSLPCHQRLENLFVLWLQSVICEMSCVSMLWFTKRWIKYFVTLWFEQHLFNCICFNHELERMWKCFKIMFQNFPRRTEKNCDNLTQDRQSLVWDFNLRPCVYEAWVLETSM
jgi:hypothetical protein